MTLKVAIIGRPNVGKSTLFNRLVGKRIALVDDTPGVTRDRREGAARIADLEFIAIDTAGLEDIRDASLESRMRQQTEAAVQDADITFFMIDVRAGITPMDKHFADWIRGTGQPAVLLANKCEGKGTEAGLLEAFELGMGEAIPVSAEHALGLDDLYQTLRSFSDENIHSETEDDDNEDEDEDQENLPIRLAIVGRPNVGKSTLVNRLLGEDRVLTGPEAGITRDAITVPFSHHGRIIELVDTAGLRKKARITEKLEGLSVADTLNTIRYAHVVVLVLDSEAMLEKQDLAIARHAIEEGRGLVIAVNKWDLIGSQKEALQKLSDRLQRSLTQVRGIPIVTLSAKTGKGVNKLMDAVLDLYGLWNTRISTAKLNRWLDHVIGDHPPPLASGRRVKIRYMTQAKTRPPTFILFASQPQGLPDSYVRYLSNALREDFKLPGTPLRLFLRKGDNPYDPSD